MHITSVSNISDESRTFRAWLGGDTCLVQLVACKGTRNMELQRLPDEWCRTGVIFVRVEELFAADQHRD